MPSAVMKPEKKLSVEAEEPLKTAITVVEKKLRNLEKKKSKLDDYRSRMKSGAKLNDDQKQAIAKYDSVLASLEFAKELQKQFTEIQEKAEKLMKKKMKYEQKLQRNEEVQRIQEILRLQNLLDLLGAEETRDHFKNGTQGALALSEEKLNQLDTLYKLISPTRDGETSYTEQLVSAAEHLSCFVEGKEKEVAGTTYKELKELIAEISGCDYFENSETEKTETEENKEETEDANENKEDEAEQEETKEEAEDLESLHSNTASEQISHPAKVKHPAADFTFTQQTLPPQAVAAPPSFAAPPAVSAADVTVSAEDESFFSTMDLTKPRNFTDIVSSVQGSFNFLQESEIDLSTATHDNAHVDPAVIAAKPIASKAYSQSLEATSLSDQMATLGAQDSGADTEAALGGSQSATASEFSQQAASSQHGYEQTQQQAHSWAAAAAADNSWGNSAAEHNSWADQTPSTQSQSWADQAASPHQPQAWSTNTASQSLSSGVPAPIPMPNETVPGQSLSFAAGQNLAQDSQKSQLNPNANIFMYGESGSGGYPSQQQGGEFDARRSGPKDQGGYGGQDGFQTQGYRGRDYRGGQRGGSREGGMGGGPRGSGGRGGGYQGRGGRGGYGGSRGGSSGQSAPYQNGGGSGRGGMRGGMRGGPRGGSGGPRGEPRGGMQSYGGGRPSSGQ